MKYLIVLISSLLIVGNNPSEAAAFTNGSFEQGKNVGTTLGKDSTDIAGWKVDRDNIDYVGNYWQPAQGERSIDLNGLKPGGIEQSFDTVFGNQYEITFALAGNPDGGPVKKTLDVRLNNAFLAGGITIHPFSFDTTGKTKANMGWTDQNFSFTSGANRAILTFISTTTNSPYGPAIDNVRIVDKGPSPVPVPGSLLLFLSGLVPVFRILKSPKGR